MDFLIGVIRKKWLTIQQKIKLGLDLMPYKTAAELKS